MKISLSMELKQFYNLFSELLQLYRALLFAFGLVVGGV